VLHYLMLALSASSPPVDIVLSAPTNTHRHDASTSVAHCHHNHEWLISYVPQRSALLGMRVDWPRMLAADI